MKLIACLFLTSTLFSCSFCDYSSEYDKFIRLSIQKGKTNIAFEEAVIFKPFRVDIDNLNKIPLSYAHDQVWIEFTDSLGNKDTLSVTYQISPYYDETCNHGGVHASDFRINYNTLPFSFNISVSYDAY